MTRRKQSRGTCAFCGRDLTKGGMANHLRACPQRKEAIQTADQGRGIGRTLLHLRVQDAWLGDFWLHLEMDGRAKLGELDRYLRAIWLECCGHLSQFSVGGWRGKEIPMWRWAEKAFNPGMGLTHIYDFGTSSHTLIQAIDERKGKPLTAHPVFLMARNNPPELVCMECDQPATWLCHECQYEDDKEGLLCDAHAEGHPHEDHGGPMPIVNSPRVGMCGYCGPAEPPY
jgi:hypothetical protein